MNDPYLLAILIAVVAGLLGYAIFVPKNQGRFSPNNQEERKSDPMLSIATYLGDELFSVLPAGVFNLNSRVPNPKIEALLKRSGNPWNLNSQEFIFFHYVYAFIGFVASIASWYLLSFVGISFPWFIFIPGFTLLAAFYPRIKYNDEGKKRDLEFKRRLPEALDLMIISLSAGSTFNKALSDSIPNMQDGALKEEFKEIVRQINLGRPMSSALDDFAKRAPNDSISTFVKSVQEANELNVPLTETLQARADASREDFFALIHQKTASLESKMMVALTPTLIPAMLIIVLAPAAMSLLNSMG